MDDAGPSNDNAPAAAAPADAVEPTVPDDPELRSGFKRIQPLQAPEWIYDITTDDTEIWQITPGDQMQDPQIRFIRESCSAPREDRETWPRQRVRTAREHMLAYVLDFNELVYRLTKYGPRVLVTHQRCFALVHSYHRLLETGGHRGAAAMANRLRQHYYWDGMLTHCERMCQLCEVCRNRDVPSGGGAVATQVMKDPPFPCHTVSIIDHKTVTAPKGAKYQYILVIVDVLTRFVTAGSNYIGGGDFSHLDDAYFHEVLLSDGDQI
eukprot:6213024-Pleurochrysis_carterae.AAC.4